MKKTLFCNVPMTNSAAKCVYKSEDSSIPVSTTAVRLPVAAFLEKTLATGDEVNAILLVKKDEFNNYKAHVSECIEELVSAVENASAKVSFKIIDTDFEENQSIHDQLLLSIVNEIDEGAHIVADITYGPKDLPIVLFTALNFAEKFLNSEIDNIIYGQVSFSDGNVVNARICDMVPLYYLNSVSSTLQCSTPDKAKQMLKSLLSL